MCDPCYPCCTTSCKSHCHSSSCGCCKCRPCGGSHTKCPYCNVSCHSCTYGSKDEQIAICPCCGWCSMECCDEVPLKKCKSRELRGSILYVSCDCVKHNGLQDQCRRRDCRDKEQCCMKPTPICCPSEKPLKFMYKTMGMPSNRMNLEGRTSKRCRGNDDENDENECNYGFDSCAANQGSIEDEVGCEPYFPCPPYC